MRHLGTRVATTSMVAGALLAGGAVTGSAASALDWSPCPSATEPATQCAWLTRPMDTRAPNGATVRLRVMRTPATGTPEERIGTLFYNPGGPGAAATPIFPIMAAGFAPEVRRHFDIATWDPRGIGASKPALLGCDLTQPVRPVTGRINWNTVLTDWTARVAEGNAKCLARYPKLLANMGSVDAARDLDALRAAVGDAKLNYWGMSYGTVIGATYAQMFPSKVRALVLDGNVDPNANFSDMARSASAPDAAFRFFTQVHPGFGPKYTRVLNQLGRTPIKLGGGRMWDRWDLIDLTTASLTSEASWPGLQYMTNLADAALFGAPAQKKAAIKILSGPDKQAPALNDNTGAFMGVFCADRPGRPGSAEMWDVTKDVIRHGPLLSATTGITFIAACAGTQAMTPKPIPQPAVIGPSVQGIVANATRDPATPFGWAVQMARAFPSMRMVSYVDGVHIIWNRTASACVDEPINAFVITLEQPANDLACPFVMPAEPEQPVIG